MVEGKVVSRGRHNDVPVARQSPQRSATSNLRKAGVLHIDWSVRCRCTCDAIASDIHVPTKIMADFHKMGCYPDASKKSDLQQSRKKYVKIDLRTKILLKRPWSALLQDVTSQRWNLHQRTQITNRLTRVASRTVNKQLHHSNLHNVYAEPNCVRREKYVHLCGDM